LYLCRSGSLILKRASGTHGTARHGTARHGSREEKYEKELSKLLDKQSDEVKNIMRAPWNMGSREEKVAECNTKYQGLIEEMRQRQEQDATKMEVRTARTLHSASRLNGSQPQADHSHSPRRGWAFHTAQRP
jgi:hypothetical protein